MTADPMHAPVRRVEGLNGNPTACTAHSKNTGQPCGNPAVAGTNVCRMHGGSAPQTRRKANLRLIELIDPAIATLAREMTSADKSSDRQNAANSILDRAGVPRRAEVSTDDVRARAAQLLMQMRDTIEGEVISEQDERD